MVLLGQLPDVEVRRSEPRARATVSSWLAALLLRWKWIWFSPTPARHACSKTSANGSSPCRRAEQVGPEARQAIGVG